MIKTLLQISGVENKQIDWNNCNLLLIDMQNQYFERELDLKERGRDAVLKAKSVLDFARNKKVNIFHVIHVSNDK